MEEHVSLSSSPGDTTGLWLGADAESPGKQTHQGPTDSEVGANNTCAQKAPG